MLGASARRSAKRLLQSQAASRLIHSGGLIPQSVPAVATQSKNSGGWLSSLLGNPSGSTLPSILEPLPGLTLPPAPEFPSKIDTVVSTLPNGVKIASEEAVGPTATVSIFIDSGSVYEDPTTSGVSHALEKMAFKSTLNRSHFRLVREVEAIGAHVAASASREQMGYSADAIKSYVPEVVEILADTVRNPAFLEWELKDELAKIHEEVKSMATHHTQTMLLEALHSAAYAGSLGQPLAAHETSLKRINGDLLAEFVQANYTAPRIVVAASGVSHADLTAAVTPLFEDLPALPAPQAPPSQYVGGDWRMAAESELTHVLLGFEFPGGWRNEKDAVAAVVLQSLLGGGGSFSAGGPGKGMYSRLYTRVLNKHADVQSCSAFSSIYNTTGVVGIHATAGSYFVPSLVDLVTKEFLAVASPGGVTVDELERAKNATISSVLMNLESRMVVAEDIGRQILTYGHRKHPQEFLASVKAVKPADITAVAQKIIKTPLAMASYGDVVHVPRFDQVAARFG